MSHGHEQELNLGTPVLRDVKIIDERIGDCGTYRTQLCEAVGDYSSIPFALRTPLEAENEMSAMYLCPGFTDGKDGLRRLARMATKRGVITISIDHPRFFHPEHGNDQEAHKVENIFLAALASREILDREVEFDMVGHSEGGANTSRFAQEHHDMVGSIIVMASGGLIEGDNVEKIMLRAGRHPSHIVRHLRHFVSHPGYDLRIAANTMRYVLKQPLKAREEAAQIASADIRSRFASLRQHKVYSGALQFLVDELFPLDKVIASVSDESSESGTIFDLFEVYPYVDAGHLTPQIHPNTTAEILIDMINKLRNLPAR